MNYTLTKIKTFMGREGHGLNAVVLLDGKPVAYVMDDASGGETDFDFRNPGQTPQSFKATTYEQAHAAELAFAAFCAKWYADSGRMEKDAKEFNKYNVGEPSWSPTPRFMMESWVNHQVDEVQNKKRFDRIAKKKTLFRIDGDPVDTWRTLKMPYTDPKAKEFLDKKYGSKVVAIYGVDKAAS